MRELRFVITSFCNYRCFFCHSESTTEKISLRLRPSDYEFMAATAKNNLGWNTCTITGGEPLISPIYKEICEMMKKMGIAITVVTNASLLARPEEMLKDVSQINISIHTMSPDTYARIIQTNYPLESVLSTIVTTRAKLPELDIHLNYTVIRGMNDTDLEFEKLLKFADGINAKAKFIDLSTTDESLIVDADEIIARLEKLGFKVKGNDYWQYFLTRGAEQAIVTKCPFNNRYENLPARDIFVDTNGTLYKSFGGYLAVDALNEIKARDNEGFIQKINVLLKSGL